MNELQRTEYLTALGVTSYMPRFCLPLAPQPVQAVLPPPAEAVVEGGRPATAAALMQSIGVDVAQESRSSTAPSAPAPAQSQEGVERVIGRITAETKSPEPQVQSAPVAAPEKPVAPFILSCWWLGEELLAVDSREPGSALPVESLFGNMARALGWHQLPSQRDKLKWPLAENPFAMAAGASDARETCRSWLEAASARKSVKSIWLMGEQAQSFCAPVPLDDSVADWDGTSVVALPSLTELLTEPARKRDVWQLLRKLYPEQTRSQ
ncbi:hypothetical protein [Microbulbifer agarilyticus]|uniref:hypothetical protein n=1 Tax=Microbulbifer agarilyticus TaxID=260552 RepID=UPI001CD3AB30|nr:hypothetical protein [Microbulbifer agarilyticus]MCA0901558.1 hypothetical protein [Microbulbifer agarilyticus]